MRIAGLQKCTLLDYPGKVACTVFLPGCNFRCPFCHNSELLDAGLPVFTELQRMGEMSDRQIYNTFNMGIGMVFAVDASEADAVIAALEACGEKAYKIGCVAKTGEDGERLVLK